MKINKTKFIAEIGVNHNGSIKLAKKIDRPFFKKLEQTL